jgi:hypothetical protein
MAGQKVPLAGVGADPGAGSGGGGGYGGMPKSAKTLYQARDFAGAVRELTSLAAKKRGFAAKKYNQLANSVRGLASSLSRGDSSMTSDTAQAVLLYKNALAADSGLGGAHQGLIKGKLFRVAKVRAGALFSSGKYSACYRMILLAAQYGSAGLGRMRDQLSSKAQEIFNNGYIIRASNPSRAKDYWRQVLTMVPASDKYAKKARFYIGQHGGGGAVSVRPAMRYTPPRRRYTPPRRRRYTPPRRRATRPRPMRRRPRYFEPDEGEDE